MHYWNYVLIFTVVIIGPAVRAYLGGKNSEKYTTTPEGAVRVRAPRFQLVAGIIFPFIGIPFIIGGLLLMRYAFISWSTPGDPSSVSPDQLTPFSLIAIAVFAAGIFFTAYSFLIIMSVRNEYVETGIDYVEKRERLGKITRIMFHEISSYSYSPRSEGGKLTIRRAQDFFPDGLLSWQLRRIRDRISHDQRPLAESNRSHHSLQTSSSSL